MRPESLQNLFYETMKTVQSSEDLEKVRVQFLGKSSELSSFMKQLGALSPDERKNQGALLNQIRQQFETAIADKAQMLEAEELNKKLEADAVDITMPVSQTASGTLHPLSQAMYEAIQVFTSMGFGLADGPEIEDDYHNFTALKIPHSHPARQMQDTFYVNAIGEDGHPMVLRTQTSSVQIRVMETHKPPLKIIVPGRVFRSDSDATHTPNFHQIEGLYIDKNIHMGHLKACLLEFCQRFFEQSNLKIRFRPSFFPFTEPSAEMDVSYTRTKGKILIGEGTDWLEILGCGMVHPKVLENCGISSQEYQGFAWGMGVDRLAMLKYGITDLRAFFEGDIRWSRHYGFSLGQSYGCEW